jgi:ATP-binding cassette subfamily F protein uup
VPLVTLDQAAIAFGHLPLLQDASLQIEAGERIALIGRNGSGKSTLLQLIEGVLQPDRGTVWRQPGIRVARLEQDVPLSDARAVFDVVADGIGDLAALVTAYHHAAIDVAAEATPARLARLGRLQETLEERDGWRLEQRVEWVLSRLRLPADAAVDTLSGGWRRRVLLARALVGQPDVLLLDEPTNHLDLDAIAWLEEQLLTYPGAVVFITHDRAFLERLASRILELDRGGLTSWPCDYATYLGRKEAASAAEADAVAAFDKKLAGEEAWLRRGVKARRTRDEGRVRALVAMRAERAARRAAIGTARIQIDAADLSGKLVFELDRVTKRFDAATVIDGFSARIVRGDRVGLIGPNGAGKTTLLRLILGDLAPDAGEVRRGANVHVAYYDQQREQLDPERSVVETVADGNDSVTVGGRTRHVMGYLADFLFPPERARSPVRALSGGERNRLLVARLLTRPANVLVLDEPTNDLDLETLELVEQQLVAWPGTLLLVSHDRRFLDHVVTSTYAFEGRGRVVESVGGYEDWLRQRPTPADGRPAPLPSPPRVPTAVPRRRLTFKEQRELASLPAAIEALETEQQALDARIAGPEFYKEGSVAIRAVLARQEALRDEVRAAYERWVELEGVRELAAE